MSPCSDSCHRAHRAREQRQTPALGHLIQAQPAPHVQRRLPHCSRVTTRGQEIEGLDLS